MQGYKGTGLQGCRVPRLKGYKVIRLKGCRVSIEVIINIAETETIETIETIETTITYKDDNRNMAFYLSRLLSEPKGLSILK